MRASTIPEKVLKPNCNYIADKTKPPIHAYFYSVDILYTSAPQCFAVVCKCYPQSIILPVERENDYDLFHVTVIQKEILL